MVARTARHAAVKTQAALQRVGKPQLTPVAVQFKELRDRVCREHVAGGLLYLEGGKEQLRNGYDVPYKFRAESNFFYMTGVNEPEFSCIVDAETGHFTLMAPRLPPEAAFWMGGLPTLEEMAEEYGADRCCYSEDLKSVLESSALISRDIHTLPSLAGRLTEMVGGIHIPSDGNGAPACAPTSTSSPFSSLRVMDGLLPNVLNRCRSLKTEAEVACTHQASIISGRAHMDIWRDCQPGMYEYQLEATFQASTMRAGAMQLGYPSIVGAGRNAAVLHYMSNQAQVASDDLVLVDAGAEIRNYTADISRTFPASGKFVGVRRDIYAAVLDSQEHALKMMRANVDMTKIDQECRRVLLGHLRDNLQLVKGATEELINAKVDRIFMPHGLSHFLGLDVHDVSDVGPVPKTLKAGHLITVEPGLYFIDLLIKKAAADSNQAQYLNLDRIEKFCQIGGVRIEDNVLIQEGGIRNLTIEAGCFKQINEIEDVIQGASS